MSRLSPYASQTWNAVKGATTQVVALGLTAVAGVCTGIEWGAGKVVDGLQSRICKLHPLPEVKEKTEK